jgi:Spy/CpxP family protein refolding chaperone
MVARKLGVFVATLLMAVAVPAMAQNNGGGGGGGQQGGGGAGGPGGGGGGFGGRGDPAQFRQRMMDQLKQQLGATDDEFAAIQPKIEAVMTLQRDANPGRFGMFGGRGGRGRGGDANAAPGGATTQPSGVQAAMTDLENTLNDQSAGADQIKSKLDALRDARTKAKQDLAQAQADLKSVLTQRQEAVLVLRNLLD